MDRAGLIKPADAIKVTAVTLEERDFDIELARVMGCIILHGVDNRLLTKDSHTIAIYPETGGLTLWRDAIVDVEPEKLRQQGGELSPTAQAYTTAKFDNLGYRGVVRPDWRRLGVPVHRYSRAEDIRRGDKVRLAKPDGTTFHSYRINQID